jgi:hypothetical protein
MRPLPVGSELFHSQRQTVDGQTGMMKLIVASAISQTDLKIARLRDFVKWINFSTPLTQYGPQYYVPIFVYSTQLICYTFTSFWLCQNHGQWKRFASRVALFWYAKFKSCFHAKKFWKTLRTDKTNHFHIYDQSVRQLPMANYVENVHKLFTYLHFWHILDLWACMVYCAENLSLLQQILNQEQTDFT